MKENSYNTRRLIEAALMTAFITILLIIVSYAPVISTIGTVVLPIPIAILYIRQDGKIAAACIFVSFVITSMIFDPLTSIGAAITYGGVGLTLGYCVKKKKSSYYTLMLLTIVSILTYILNLVIMVLFIEKTTFIGFIQSTIDMLNKPIEEIKNNAITMYQDMGVSAEKVQTIKVLFKAFNGELFILMLPASILIIGFIGAYFNFYITRLVLSKLRYEVIDMLPFSNFYVTNLVGAAFIAIISIGIILNGRGFSFGKNVAIVFFIIAMVTFSLNGLAAVTYYLRKKKGLGKGITVAIILIGITFGLGNIFFLIGFIEIIFDFRKLDPYRIRKV